jgi:hypothetical protein
MKKVFPLAVALVAVVTGVASARPLGHEAQSVIDVLLETPTIKAEPGFRAKMFIPPGELLRSALHGAAWRSHLDER